MTAWNYDPAVDVAYIQVNVRYDGPVRTIDLDEMSRCHIQVMIDTDLDGNVLGMELLGSPGSKTVLHGLERWMKEPANVRR